MALQAAGRESHRVCSSAPSATARSARSRSIAELSCSMRFSALAWLAAASASEQLHLIGQRFDLVLGVAGVSCRAPRRFPTVHCCGRSAARTGFVRVFKPLAAMGFIGGGELLGPSFPRRCGRPPIQPPIWLRQPEFPRSAPPGFGAFRRAAFPPRLTVRCMALSLSVSACSSDCRRSLASSQAVDSFLRSSSTAARLCSIC